ncbi:YheC/YheD family protein [Rossellomorea aquimaris]|uniref:YheC/YheD family endospore coat-associated protein n=1 Tax=Rossellomorea aquimaris TaxID=189382 RepID=UPI001CD7D81C|nr:YheC/YheD family protein [Rossellomorea aquimaris]MCA1056497.1 YheC/YheD family protein [Rossellomorea aquimaris]
MTAVPFARESFLLSSKQPDDAYTFDIHTGENAISIPLIGIIASKEGAIYKGNFELFRSIQLDVASRGGMCFVFSPEDVAGKTIHGITYNEAINKWVKCLFPLPNVIYNRIPSREAEQHQDYINLKKIMKHYDIPYFNPHFFNKWEVHQILSQCKSLQGYLPPTSMVKDEKSFIEFLDRHKKIYVKPSFASQGRGIRLIEIDQNGIIICKSIKKIEKYTSLSRFLSSYQDWFQPGRDSIMQKAIACKTLRDHRYDYRVLVVHTGVDFKLMGIGVRISQRQEVTTHVPAGGKILSFKDVATPHIQKELRAIAKICGSELERAFGYVGEFSIDLAPREEGGYVLFEVNSKPMMFDEEEIESKRRLQLVQTFITLARQHKEG